MTIVLLKDFTFVGSMAQSFATDWVSFPAEYKQAEMFIVVKSRIIGSSLTAQLQGTYDTDSVVSVGGSSVLTAQGTTVVQITSSLTPMVRLLLTAGADSQIIISVYLTPKIS